MPCCVDIGVSLFLLKSKVYQKVKIGDIHYSDITKLTDIGRFAMLLDRRLKLGEINKKFLCRFITYRSKAKIVPTSDDSFTIQPLKEHTYRMQLYINKQPISLSSLGLRYRDLVVRN